MKKLTLTHLITITLSVILLSCAKPIQPTNELTGTWQLCRPDSSLESSLGGKEGATRFYIAGQNTFTVAEVDLSEKTFVADFIGSYTMDQNSYEEHIKYSYPGLKAYNDSIFTFKIELKNGYLIKKGTNNKFNEIWKRIEL